MNYVFLYSNCLIVSVVKMSAASIYTTYTIESWHDYQSSVPSHLHSISHYNAHCEERAKLYGEHVMILRDEVTKITGYYCCTGWSPQNCADTDGYVDVRTEKKYPHGKQSFFDDINKGLIKK